jgi:signal transduction histidine kinase
VNEESLRRANAFLAAVAEQVQAGEPLNVTPADIGKKIGLPDPLAAARAVRALLARRRLEIANGSYRLVDPRPLEPGEPEAVPRPPRRKRAAGGRRAGEPGRLTFSEVGRSAIERLIDLGREVGTLRGNLRTAREEVRAAREAKDVAERQAQSMSARVRDLEAKLEMAESNLRTILTAARGTAARADRVGDAEMDAILAVLKGQGGRGL